MNDDTRASSRRPCKSSMMIQTYTIEQAQEGHVSLQWWLLQSFTRRPCKSSMMIQTYTIEQAQEGHVSLQWWYKLTL